MTTAASADTRIDKYLSQVRSALRGLPATEIDDILRELRAHATELAGKDGQGIETALQSLGDPVDLAKTYRAENQMVRAECSGSPLVILQGLRHSARSGLGRITATALFMFGYITLITLWAGVIHKFFSPSLVGLWYTPGNLWSLTLITGDSRAPLGAHELLGWWLVPIVVLVGWVVKVVTDRIAQWWIRRYRQSKAS